ncbi:MAG: beta-ketoacyl-[acyl-carrier-protein] synthase family protein [Planctomycetota bacterium]|jgi:nodulation protein E
MERRRVVITGLGVISALGKNCAEFWAAIREGRSGIAPIEAVDMATITFKNGAEVRGFDPKEFLDKREDRTLLDPFAQFALICAREAVQDAGITFDDGLQQRAAVITGSSVSGVNTEEAGYRDLYALGKKRAHPLSIPKMMGNAGASRVSMEYGLRGPVYTLTTACSSANHAMGLAYWTVRDGVADVALTGGSEAIFTLANLRAWDALRVVSPDTCRPFSKDRQGMILGEGGATLVLETLEHAQQRGARIYAEVCGFGMSADAHHLTMASVEGPARAMQAALDDGGIGKEEVSYINAHGTGTLGNDPNETKAIREVFGQHADSLAVSSTKSMHGHTLGAAGAVEAVATVLGIEQGILPPTANFNEPDPECNLDVVPNKSRPAELRAALSNSFAFGGLNAVLAFRKFTP